MRKRWIKRWLKWSPEGRRFLAQRRSPPRTGAERYFAARMQDPDYRAAYDEARERMEGDVG